MNATESTVKRTLKNIGFFLHLCQLFLPHLMRQLTPNSYEVKYVERCVASFPALRMETAIAAVAFAVEVWSGARLLEYNTPSFFLEIKQACEHCIRGRQLSKEEEVEAVQEEIFCVRERETGWACSLVPSPYRSRILLLLLLWQRSLSSLSLRRPHCVHAVSIHFLFVRSGHLLQRGQSQDQKQRHVRSGGRHRPHRAGRHGAEHHPQHERPRLCRLCLQQKHGEGMVNTHTHTQQFPKLHGQKFFL